VALEIRLVHGDILDGDDALGALEFHDAIDEKERVAVRQEIHDFLDREGHSVTPRERASGLLFAPSDYKYQCAAEMSELRGHFFRRYFLMRRATASTSQKSEGRFSLNETLLMKYWRIMSSFLKREMVSGVWKPWMRW
jgi:hypothetical protein